jgi:high-affinity iron transporter
MLQLRFNVLHSRLFRINLNSFCLGKAIAKGYYWILILLLSASASYAETGESSRVLIHTLNYLSQDYFGAVSKDGKIISESEYHEQKEFGEGAVRSFNECAHDWKATDSASIRSLIYTLDSLVQHHASADSVSAIAIRAKDLVVKASGLRITPITYPNLENGKLVFKTECAKCHGPEGYGDGPEGKGLNPQPKNFHDDEKIRPFSPFFVFNTVRLGVEGTGMKAHVELEESEVWDVAFYALSFRYQKLKGREELNTEAIKALLDTLKLDKIATTSDEDFIKQLHLTDTAKAKYVLAAIRLNQPSRNNSEFINTALKYLDGAWDLYQQGKTNQASELATLSYLEGIEPLEMQLKSNDPQMMARLEDQLHYVGKMMSQQKSAGEVKDSINEAKKTIQAAGELLYKKEYSFIMALLMAVSILLREGLEAFLVIMVILSILKATELKNASIWVHAGWVVAVLAGVVLWLIGGSLLSTQVEHMELVEGVISLVAVFMLLYIGFWLHGKSEINKWKDYVSKMMSTAVKNESMLGLASLSFFVVFREVFESVLFLSALNVEAGGKQGNAIALGVTLAFVIVIVLAFVLLRFSAKLPIPKLFRFSSLVMGLLAFVLAGKGVHSLQETGHSPIHGIHFMRVELLGIFPTIETCAAQLVILVLLVFIWNSGKQPVKK